MAIPQGKVATYGQIAMLCGKPRNSRQVGYGLRENLAGEDVPAFRVVNSKGELSGANHFLIPGLQRTLLEDDGVEVFWNGQIWCVDLKEYGWKTTWGMQNYSNVSLNLAPRMFNCSVRFVSVYLADICRYVLCVHL